VDSVTAFVSGLPTVIFVDTVRAAAAAKVETAGGDGQSAHAGTALAAPCVILVSDAYGNGVAGVTVVWATNGGGSLSAATSVTDAAGHAGTTLTLGPAAGVQNVTATVAGLAPVTFTEAAN